MSPVFMVMSVWLLLVDDATLGAAIVWEPRENPMPAWIESRLDTTWRSYPAPSPYAAIPLAFTYSPAILMCSDKSDQSSIGLIPQPGSRPVERKIPMGPVAVDTFPVCPAIRLPSLFFS